MLPDLRIVIAAVASTFILTVGVGFFASSRLIHEQMTTRVDTKGLDDTPINRIALNWPEPTKVERKIDLDFAVSAKGSGNPVRDVTPDLSQVETQPAPAKPEAPSASLPETERSPQPTTESRDPEPAVVVAKAPDPVEDKLPEAAAWPDSIAETRVTVHPNDTPPVESTGSIAAPAPASPDIPLPEARPKFAARPDATDAALATKPDSREPAKALDAGKTRPKKAAAKPRPVARSQTPQVQQQAQPFDFFGLFRAPPATLRLSPQVSTPPMTPIN